MRLEVREPLDPQDRTLRIRYRAAVSWLPASLTQARTAGRLNTLPRERVRSLAHGRHLLQRSTPSGFWGSCGRGGQSYRARDTDVTTRPALRARSAAEPGWPDQHFVKAHAPYNWRISSRVLEGCLQRPGATRDDATHGDTSVGRGLGFPRVRQQRLSHRTSGLHRLNTTVAFCSEH